MTERYSKLAVVLHWLIAIGIFLNLKSGLGFDDLPKSQLGSAIGVHESFGISVLGLVLLRILWRIGHQPPALPVGYKPWERKLSTATHHTLYLLMVLVPLLGWLHESAWKGAATHPLVLFGTVTWFHLPLFGGLAPAAREHLHELFGDAHGASAWLLMAALVLHVGGALKHQFIDKDKELQRMWFGGKTN